MNKRILFAAASGMAIMGGGWTAHAAAAEDAATTKEASFSIEEIVVTAQKREENLQKIPISMTAVNASMLERRGIVNLGDIKKVVPNLYLEEALSSATTPKAFMRGVGVDNQVFSFDTPIGFYVDGVYYARATGALVDLFDIDRVEVLRGPQGTLYGRNSSAGAIRVITKDPNLQDVEFIADATYGSRNQINGRMSVSIPIQQDTLGMRISLSTRNNDGYMKDISTGKKFMNDNIQAGRASVLYTPNESWKLTLRGDFMADHSKPRQGSNFLINPDNDIYTFESSPGVIFENIVDTWGTSATAEWIGNTVDITSVTAYRGLKYRNSNDVDGRADVRSFEVDRQDLDEWQFSQELYASGNKLGNTPLNWVVGAYYFHEKNEFFWALRIFAPPTTQIFNQDTDTFAVYGQLTYPVTDKLSLTGGGRYTYEKKAMTASQLFADGTPNTGFSFDDSIVAKKATWRAAADYQVTDDILLYTSASTGFRSGGFNGSARDVASILSGSFGPETSFAVEGGFKSTLLDGRMRFNADYFWTKYKDLQLAVTRSDGTITTSNVEATVHGLEAELTALPFEGMEITGTLGTMSNNIKDSPLVLKDTPKLNFTLGANYTIPVAGLDGSIRLGGNMRYSSGSFSDTNNAPSSNTGRYAIVDADISYESDNGNWAVTLRGYNLTDKYVPLHTFDIAGGFISSVQFPNTPRHYALTVRYKY